MTKMKPSSNTTQNQTLAYRLRALRDEMGLTRKSVSEETGIPTISIEKFENGTQEPTVSRLLILAELYKTSVYELLDIGTADLGQLANNDNKNHSEDLFNDRKILNNENSNLDHADDQNEQIGTYIDPLKKAKSYFLELDTLREGGFVNAQRKALSLAKILEFQLNELEPFQIEKLAAERQIFNVIDENVLGRILDEGDDLSIIYSEVPHLVEEYIQEHLIGWMIDTAIYGIDPMSIEKDAFEEYVNSVSEEYPIEAESSLLIFQNSSQEYLVQKIRPFLRGQIISGQGPVFSDTALFPQKEE